MGQPCKLSCFDLLMAIVIVTNTSFVFGDCQITCDAEAFNLK